MAMMNVLSSSSISDIGAPKKNTVKGDMGQSLPDSAAAQFSSILNNLAVISNGSKGQNSGEELGDQDQPQESKSLDKVKDNYSEIQAELLRVLGGFSGSLQQILIQSNFPAGKEVNSGLTESQKSTNISVTATSLTGNSVPANNTLSQTVSDLLTEVFDQPRMQDQKLQGSSPNITELDKYKQTIQTLLNELSGEITELTPQAPEFDSTKYSELKQFITGIVDQSGENNQPVKQEANQNSNTSVTLISGNPSDTDNIEAEGSKQNISDALLQNSVIADKTLTIDKADLISPIQDTAQTNNKDMLSNYKSDMSGINTIKVLASKPVNDGQKDIIADTNANKATNNPGEQSAVNPGDKATNNPEEQSAVNHGDKATNNPGEQSAVNHGDKATNNPGEQSAVNTGDKVANNPGEQPLDLSNPNKLINVKAISGDARIATVQMELSSNKTQNNSESMTDSKKEHLTKADLGPRNWNSSSPIDSSKDLDITNIQRKNLGNNTQPEKNTMNNTNKETNVSGKTDNGGTSNLQNNIALNGSSNTVQSNALQYINQVQTKPDQASIVGQIATALNHNIQQDRNEVKEFSIQLHPEDLGKVQVYMRWDNGSIHLQVHAADTQTGNLIQNHLADLRQALENSGVSCGMLQMGLGGQKQQQSKQYGRNFFSNQKNTEAESDKEFVIQNNYPSGNLRGDYRLNVTA